MKLHARNSNGNKNGSLQSKIFLDDCLDKFDVLLLVKDGEVCLSHVSQSEICSYSPSLVDRQAVLVASCQVFTPLGSRGAVLLLHVVNGGPEGSINSRIFIPDRVSPFRYVVGQPHVIHYCLVMAPILMTNVMFGQMSC